MTHRKNMNGSLLDVRETLHSQLKALLCSVFFLFLFLSRSFGQRTLDRTFVKPFEDYGQCKVGFMSAKGDTLFPAKFENLKKVHAVSIRGVEMVDYERGWAWILSENNQFGCLSELGTWIVPCKYEQLSFNAGFGAFIARQQGKYGVVGLNNAVLVPFEFDEILTDWEIPRNFPDLVPVRKDKKVGLYSLSQRKVVSPVYESIAFMKYADDQPDWTKGEHFVIYSNGKAGVSSRQKEELIAPKYQKITYLEAASSGVNPIYFLVANEQNRQAVFNEDGKQLTAFLKGKVSPAYDKTESWEKTLQFVEVEDSLRNKYLVNLSNGKQTEPYLRKCVFANCVFLQLNSEWKILDYNFKELYVNPYSERLLWFDRNGFPMWDEEKEDYRFYNDAPEDWNPKKEPLPFFVLLREDSLGAEEKAACLDELEGRLKKKDYSYECGWVAHYALFDLETKKVSPFSYMELRRFQYNDEVYYWAFHDFEGTERKSRKVDVYNNKGKKVRQISAFYLVDYTNGGGNEVLYAKSDEEYMLYDIAGNQLSSYVYHSYPNILLHVNNNFGVVVEYNEEEGTRQFFNYDHSPLLNGRKYNSYNYIEDHNYNIQAITLQEGDNLNTLLSNQFNILLDSCSIYTLDGDELKADYENPFLFLFTKDSKAYVLENGKMAVLNKSFFPYEEDDALRVRTFGYKYIEIDRFGNIIPEPPAPEQLVIQAYGSIFLTETKEGLRVENQNHEFVQLIENVEKYNTHKGLLEITLKNYQKGVLSMKTGNWLFEPGNTEMYAFRNRPGKWYWINYLTNEFPRWRLIDSAGNLVTNLVFDAPVGYYSNAFCAVFKRDGLFGTIDTNLNIITEPTYLNAEEIYGGKRVLYDNNGFSLVDETSGKVFPLKYQLSTKNYLNGHLLFSHDSIQVVANDGSPLTKLLSIDQAIDQLDLNVLLNGKTFEEENGIVDDINRKVTNHIFIESARQAIVYLYIYNNSLLHSLPNRDCTVRPVLISKKYYVEKLTGICYKPPLCSDSVKQQYFYNNYRIENEKLVSLNLSDLFKPHSGYEQVLDSLIEKEIQRWQFFGTNCIDMPGAVREFKRNFYFDEERLYLVHYPSDSQIGISFKQLEGFLKE